MHGYKHSIDEFATALGGVVTSSGNGVKVPHPFDDTCCVLVYPNRDITSKTAFFVQLDDDERSDLKRHFGEILNTAGIDARDTGLNVPIPDPEPEFVPTGSALYAETEPEPINRRAPSARPALFILILQRRKGARRDYPERPRPPASLGRLARSAKKWLRNQGA